MAKQITQPISDHDSACTQYYTVEWKLSTETSYNSMIQYTSPIVINNVLDSAMYDVRITRKCCNGIDSTPLVLSIDTTTTSPILDAPENFTLTPDGTGELDAAWDDVTDATSYHGILSTTSDFASIVYFFNTLDPQVSIPITGLDSGTTYYGKVLARASGYTDSPYSNVDSATAP